MAGFANDIVYANNGDFSIAGSSKGQAANGLLTNGQMWIGATALNVGGTHINVGTVVSPLGTITIGYASPNITLDITGGAAAIEKINLQTGTSPIVPAAGIITFNGAVVAAGTNPVRTDGTGANTMALEVQTSQALAAADATKIGLSNFDSASFSVAATGFVTMAGGGGFTWNDVSGAFSPLKNNGYFITGTATGTLPAAPAQGDTVKFFVDHASQVLTIQATAGKIIRLGSAVTAAAGTAVSTAQGDSVELTYRTSDTCWCAISGFSGIWDLT